MLASLVLVVPGVWLRAYAAGYVRKNAELTRTGPYAHTRNPLYLGSMMIAFGFAAAAGSWIILVVLAALFAAIYLPTIRSEEQYLREHFAGFDDYAQKVPRLLPRLTAAPTRRRLRELLLQALPAPPRVQCQHGRYRHLCGAGGSPAVFKAVGCSTHLNPASCLCSSVNRPFFPLPHFC